MNVYLLHFHILVESEILELEVVKLIHHAIKFIFNHQPRDPLQTKTKFNFGG